MGFSLFKKNSPGGPTRPSAPVATDAAPPPSSSGSSESSISTEPGAERPEFLDDFPEPIAGIGNFDLPPETVFGLEFAESELLEAVAAAVEKGDYELPHIPSTHLSLLDLTSDPECDVSKLDRQISADVALTASLLRLANSVMFGGARRVETVRGAVLRIGVRGLRSALLSLSVKSVIFKSKDLEPIAEEIWRQSVSVAVASRALAVPLCLDPERFYVLGLLHDIGKVPLLEILRKHAPKGFAFRRPFVGQVFDRWHEEVGRALTECWGLPEEIVAVAGCHHDFAANKKHAQSAALVNLAHRQDLFLSTGRADEYRSLADDEAMDAVGIAAPMRVAILDAVRQVYVQQQREGSIT